MAYYGNVKNHAIHDLRQEIIEHLNPRPHKFPTGQNTPEENTDIKAWYDTRRSETRAIIDEYPKQARRKKVHCPFTGELTDDPYPFSRKVYDLVRDGLYFRRIVSAQDTDKRRYVFLERWGNFTLRGKWVQDGNRGYEERDEMEVVHDFLKANNIVFDRVQAYDWRKKFNAGELGTLIGPEIKEDFVGQPRLIVATMTAAQAEYLTRLVEFVRNSQVYSFERGRAEGESMLLGLATGRTTIEDYNNAQQTN